MLEDHLGDILRKAREAVNASPEVVAKVTGLSLEAVKNIESTGQAPGTIQPFNDSIIQLWAELVGLQPAKLAVIARGWRPEPRDLCIWRELRIITTSQNGITVNCYLVWDEISREGALFDTGWDAGPILQVVEKNGVQLKHLFLTHTHEDHVAAMGALRERYPKLLLHTNSRNAPPQHRNRPNDFLHLGNLRMTNRACPGHAEDGVIYVIGNWPEDAPHVAIVGDTVFAGSIASGLESAALLKQNIVAQIFTLPAETLLCPGHGPLTTVAEEKAHNPFFS
jgi:glyoxylase-like metal-dependent hydrolase (beta-lactamase superfamily II)